MTIFQNTLIVFGFHKVNKYSQANTAAVDPHYLKFEVAE